MKRWIALTGIWGALVSIPSWALAGIWPKLEGDHTKECVEALQVAKSTFKAESFYLYEPPQSPPSISSKLVLSPQALDISGGDALEAKEDVFDKLPLEGDGATRSVYWQKVPVFGYRLAVQEVAFGWRGDQYSLFAVPEKVSPDDFLADVRKSGWATIVPATIASTWRPPLIFQAKRGNRYWVIAVGEPYQVFSNWRVYVAERQGLQHQCSIRFWPSVKATIDLLPTSVRKLAVLLDQTLGHGDNEGTLHPTARLRLEAEYTWANAALRPWVSGKPYNTRDEVDSGLQSWSEQGDSYRLAYRKIEEQYKLAQRSLAKYYQSEFGLSPNAASAQASYILDIALRSYYVFPSSVDNKYFRDTNTMPNPWRKK